MYSLYTLLILPTVHENPNCKNGLFTVSGVSGNDVKTDHFESNQLIDNINQTTKNFQKNESKDENIKA